jgi:hypothetical protein
MLTRPAGPAEGAAAEGLAVGAAGLAAGLAVVPAAETGRADPRHPAAAAAISIAPTAAQIFVPTGAGDTRLHAPTGRL